MATTETSQRKRAGRHKSDGRVVRLQVKDGMGNPRWITADLFDVSETGLCVATLAQLASGAKVVVRGSLDDARTGFVGPAMVKWCTEKINGCYHVGLELGEGRASAASEEQPAQQQEDLDFYEVMQLSPNADTDTVGRVYRILAQRYHPDTAKTGNAEMFLRLSEAHRVLIDPELRAKYDSRYQQTRRLRWKIFDQAKAASGAEGERRKRLGILQLLYAKTIADPERGSMNLFELEELLGCPREHLESALWYLRGKGLVKRADNGRVEITVTGFDEAENNPGSPEGPFRKLLESGEPS